MWGYLLTQLINWWGEQRWKVIQKGPRRFAMEAKKWYCMYIVLAANRCKTTRKQCSRCGRLLCETWRVESWTWLKGVIRYSIQHDPWPSCLSNLIWKVHSTLSQVLHPTSTSGTRDCSHQRRLLYCCKISLTIPHGDSGTCCSTNSFEFEWGLSVHNPSTTDGS